MLNVLFFIYACLGYLSPWLLNSKDLVLADLFILENYIGTLSAIGLLNITIKFYQDNMVEKEKKYFP